MNNSITNSLGNAFFYISEAFLQQSHDEGHQNESTWLSYQTMAVSFLAAATGAYVIKRLMPSQPIKDTPELFWKELERNHRSPLPVDVFLRNDLKTSS